jgi:hypothetical protein
MSDRHHRNNRPAITQNNPQNHAAAGISVTEQTWQNRDYKFIEENTLHLKGNTP